MNYKQYLVNDEINSIEVIKLLLVSTAYIIEPLVIWYSLIFT